MREYMKKFMKGCCDRDEAPAMENFSQMMKECCCERGSDPAEGEDKKPENGEKSVKQDKTGCA